jgi:hypothetical protein
MKSQLLAIMTPFGWNATGIIVATIGVLLLFRFGMPFRLSTGDGGDYIVTNDSADPPWKEPAYKALGYVGLFSVVFGAACQLISSWLTS